MSTNKDKKKKRVYRKNRVLKPLKHNDDKEGPLSSFEESNDDMEQPRQTSEEDKEHGA